MVQQQSLCPDRPVDEGVSTSLLDKHMDRETPSGNDDRAATPVSEIWVHTSSEIWVHTSSEENATCPQCGTGRSIHALAGAACATDAVSDSGSSHSATGVSLDRSGAGNSEEVIFEDFINYPDADGSSI
jgi:hypothetical protein